MSSQPTFGLASLIHPHTTDSFLDRNWSKEPFVVHGLDQSIKAIRALPFLQSLDSLLESWSGRIQAYSPNIADESAAIDVTSGEAMAHFSKRMGLLFNQVEKQSPVLVSVLAQIRADLGLPVATFGRCIAYATPDGKGTDPHFDQNINFVLQLFGTKKWWIARNDTVENPTERFVMGEKVHPELASYTDGKFPKTMPKDKQEIVLKPGSMLFVPRGYWHATEAEGDALALNFTFSQPTWADLFTTALRTRLNLSPEWRELADGVSSDVPSRRERAEAEFDALLMELTHDLPNWRAADVLGATEGF